MLSITFYKLSVCGYFFSIICYCFNIAMSKHQFKQLATGLVLLSFLLHTIGLLCRWGEAGLVEIRAAEQAKGFLLHSYVDKLAIFLQHPPWSNLYEIMIYMAWGMVLIFLLVEIKWHIKFLGIF